MRCACHADLGLTRLDAECARAAVRRPGPQDQASHARTLSPSPPGSRKDIAGSLPRRKLRAERPRQPVLPPALLLPGLKLVVRRRRSTRQRVVGAAAVVPELAVVVRGRVSRALKHQDMLVLEGFGDGVLGCSVVGGCTHDGLGSKEEGRKGPAPAWRCRHTQALLQGATPREAGISGSDTPRPPCPTWASFVPWPWRVVVRWPPPHTHMPEGAPFLTLHIETEPSTRMQTGHAPIRILLSVSCLPSPRDMQRPRLAAAAWQRRSGGSGHCRAGVAHGENTHWQVAHWQVVRVLPDIVLGNALVPNWFTATSH